MRNPNSNPPSVTLCLCILLLTITLAITWQIASPSDIDDNEQPITLSHFMDVAQQGHWLTQFNPFEGLSTKPPAYHWLGGIGLMLTGTSYEWQLKLSSILCFILATGLVVVLARSCLDWQASLLAGAVWVANFHVIKLAYTARPDMMLAMLMTMALVALLYQRPIWHYPTNKPRPKSYWLWLVLLWTSVALAGLTKGPPALLVLALVAIMLWHDRRLWSRELWPHVLGMLLAVGITLGWLALAIHYYPQWNQVLDKELWNRLAGDAAHVKHYPPRWREFTYFLGRFIPWSFAAIAAMIILPWWRRPAKGSAALGSTVMHDKPAMTSRPSASNFAWAAWWVIVVLGILALPKGRRADHILPVYAGASVLVAALAVWANAGHRTSRVFIHLFLGGVLISGIISAFAGFFLAGPSAMHWPVALITPVHMPTYSLFIKTTAAIAAFVAGVWGLWQLHTRRYIHAGFAASLCMTAIIGIFLTTFNRAAENRNGDQVTAFARTAIQLASHENRTPLFYDTGYVPVQTLMGHHSQMKNYKPVAGSPASTVLLISTIRGWQTLTDAGAQGQIILQTPKLEESSRKLVIVRPTWLPQSLPSKPEAQADPSKE